MGEKPIDVRGDAARTPDLMVPGTDVQGGALGARTNAHHTFAGVCSGGRWAGTSIGGNQMGLSN